MAQCCWAMTPFNGALAENPARSPDGAALAFSANAGGQGMDIWIFNAKGKQVAQVTHGANARYPGWLRGAQASAPQSAVKATTLAPAATEEIAPTLLPAPSATVILTITPIETLTSTTPFPTDMLNPMTTTVTVTR